MEPLRDRDLIALAQDTLRPVEFAKHRIAGDVAAALQTADGDLFAGVCIDTSSWGLCAERSAAAAMLTAGQYRVSRIVAVWQEYRPGRGNELYVLSPCGHCRQFLIDIDPSNADAEVILGIGNSKRLRELLPDGEWPAQPTAL